MRARTLARLELLIAVGAPLAFLAGFVAFPGWLDPMFVDLPWAVAIPAVGGAMWLIGFVAMWRMYRADPEPDLEAWRYRAPR